MVTHSFVLNKGDSCLKVCSVRKSMKNDHFQVEMTSFFGEQCKETQTFNQALGICERGELRP